MKANCISSFPLGTKRAPGAVEAQEEVEDSLLAAGFVAALHQAGERRIR